MQPALGHETHYGPRGAYRRIVALIVNSDKQKPLAGYFALRRQQMLDLLS